MQWVDAGSVAGTPQFVGRASLLRQLAAPQRSCAVLGGPKTGRTSVLQQLVHLGATALHRPARGARTVPVYVDLAAISSLRAHALVTHVWEALRAAVLDPRVQAHANPPRAEALKPRHKDDPFALFCTAADALWEQLKGTPGWCRIVLLLDNADALAEPSARPLTESLLALSDAAQAARPLAVVAAGGVAFATALRGPGPLTALRPLMLGPLRDTERLALLRAAGLQEHPLGQDVLDLSGGHPWVLAVLLRALQQASDGDAATLLRDTSPQLEVFLTTVLESLAPRRAGQPDLAGAVMGQLLSSPTEMPYTAVETQFGAMSIKPAVEALEMAAVIERTVRGNQTCLRARCAPWNAFFARASAANS